MKTYYLLIILVLSIVLISGCTKEDLLKKLNQTPNETCTESWSCSDWSECINRTQTRTCTDINNCGTEINKPETSKSCGGPKDVYMEYKNEMDKSENLDDYLAVVMKYGTEAKIEEIEASMEEYNAAPQELKEAIFNLMKGVAPTSSEIGNIEEEITGNTATLIIDSKNGTLRGTIKMVREDGTWKLEEDKWTKATPCTESWSCSEWSECINRTQTRTCTDTNDCGTTLDKPAETQSCTYIPPAQNCTENWECTDWSDCVNGTQTRTCTDTNNCGTIENKPAESQSCTIECTENWECTDWSDCVNGTQTRICTDANSCGTILNKPATSQSCSSECTSHYEKKCYLDYNIVAWFDSCGNFEEQVEACSGVQRCENAECIDLGCEEAGYINCVTDKCSGGGYVAGDTDWPDYICCFGTCKATQTCQEQNGYICSSYYKCSQEYLNATDSDWCCPVECTPKTCNELWDMNSCNSDEICTDIMVLGDSLNFYKENGILCCTNQCEPLPVCGNNECEYKEDQTDFPSWAVLCNSDQANTPPIGYCQVQSCPGDC